MRTLAAMLILGALMNSVEAAPINLTCQGLTRILRMPSVTSEETLSLSIDIAAGTVTVGAYDNAWTVPISHSDDDLVEFARVKGNSTPVGGRVNLITGDALVGITLSNIKFFKGTCRPT